MQLTNEFTVHTPIERAWAVLTDLTAVAPCLPGARLTSVDGDVYTGTVRVKVGPVVSEFAGTATFVSRDDTAYAGVIDAKGRDARSAGTASALVRARLRPAGDSTVVTVDTDLRISGKLAQFGGGMIREVSTKLLGQFVTALEARLAADDTTPTVPASPVLTTPTPPTPEPPTPPPPTSPPIGPPPIGPAVADEPAALDLVGLAGRSVYRRALPLVVGAVALAVALLVWRRVR